MTIYVLDDKTLKGIQVVCDLITEMLFFIGPNISSNFIFVFKINSKQLLKVGPFFWCPTSVEVYKGHDKCDTFTFELPPPPQKGEYNFRNSVGLQYQATEVRNCILKGRVKFSNLVGKQHVYLQVHFYYN